MFNRSNIYFDKPREYLQLNPRYRQYNFKYYCDNFNSYIGYNFNTFTGNVASFTVTPYTIAQLGTYSDTIQIVSDAANYPTFNIPVKFI